MSDFKKYKHKQTGEIIEARLTKLYVVDDCDAFTNKGSQIVLGNLGAMINIKGQSQVDVYWKSYTFFNQYVEVNNES